MIPRLLLVDDESAIRFSFSRYLTRAGFLLQEASDLSDAKKQMASQRYDAILLDLNLPDGNGLDWIPELRESRPDIAIVVITGGGDIPVAVEAMRRGADHFLTKPVNMADLEVFLRKSLEVGSLRRRSVAQNRLSRSEAPFLGEGAAMKKVIALLEVAAENDATVLLHGETGTGKGVFARWIHSASSHSSAPFVELNCSSLRGDLLGSELFGHVRGAFTSATENKQGLLDVADGGTLFLDEVGDMDLSIQSQFLKVLEEKRYRRLGDTQERRSEFRLLCATNRNLLEDATTGAFRKDLYFRIQVFPIEIPPLRERPEDLPGLVSHLLKTLRAPGADISREALLLLQHYPWPGNVRELRNVLERALLLTRGQSPLLPKHFPGLDAHALMLGSGKEHEHVRRVLERFEGDKKKAAESLGISRATLYRKLKK